jgi:hypothetical protein
LLTGQPTAAKGGKVMARLTGANWQLDAPPIPPQLTAMTAETLIDIDNRRPFQPYSLRLDNGEVVRIDKPEHCLVTEDGRTLVYNEADGKLKFIAIPNITLVE